MGRPATHDWDAFATQLHEQLDSLKPYQRPAPLTEFAAMVGCRRSGFYAIATTNPDSLWASAYFRHRQLDAKWMTDLMEAIVAGGARQGHLVAVAERWGLTRRQVEQFKHKNKDLWFKTFIDMANARKGKKR